MHEGLDRNAAGTGIALTLLDLKLLLAATRRAPQVQQLTLVNIENMRSFDRLDRGLAWRFKVGWQKDLWGEASRSLHFGVWPAGGVATAPDSLLQGYALLTAPLQLPAADPRQESLGVGGILGARLTLAQTLLGSLEVSGIHTLARATPWHVTLKGACALHLARDFAVAIGLDKAAGKRDQRLEMAVQHYF
jgi:hypothetical protein